MKSQSEIPETPQWDVERREYRTLVSRSWTCGHCGALTSGDLGVGCASYDVLKFIRSQRLMSEPEQRKAGVSMVSVGPKLRKESWLDGDRFKFGTYFCSGCQLPTVFLPDGRQIPDATAIASILGLPPKVNHLFEEVRRCMSASAYTSAMMSCRKILMNIAVEQGADKGLKFIEYVDYLVKKGYSPPNSRSWVDKIRKIGNQATHEIPEIHREDATLVVSFASALLRFVYEFPFLAEGTEKGDIGHPCSTES